MNTRALKDNQPITDPYEAAIKWIENEVHTNGVFEVKQELTECYDHTTGITRQVPTGRFSGFTITSQHVTGKHNLLQLVMEMRGDYKDLNPANARKQIKAILKCK